MHSTDEYTDPASLVRDGGATGTWTLDPSASRVDFTAKTFWGLATVSGRFQLVAGTAQVAPGGRITAEVTISAASIDTANRWRDHHLRSAHFLAAEMYPTLRIVANDIALSGKTGATVNGLVTVTERSRSVRFDSSITLATKDRAQVDAAIEVDRTEFGLTYNMLGMIGPTVRAMAKLSFHHTAS